MKTETIVNLHSYIYPFIFFFQGKYNKIKNYLSIPEKEVYIINNGKTQHIWFNYAFVACLDNIILYMKTLRNYFSRYKTDLVHIKYEFNDKPHCIIFEAPNNVIYLHSLHHNILYNLNKVYNNRQKITIGPRLTKLELTTKENQTIDVKKIIDKYSSPHKNFYDDDDTNKKRFDNLTNKYTPIETKLMNTLKCNGFNNIESLKAHFSHRAKEYVHEISDNNIQDLKLNDINKLHQQPPTTTSINNLQQ